jgi:hypothetical protein
VDLQREMEESGLDAAKFVTNPPWIGSVRFAARQLRDEGFMCNLLNLKHKSL